MLELHSQNMYWENTIFVSFTRLIFKHETFHNCGTPGFKRWLIRVLHGPQVTFAFDRHMLKILKVIHPDADGLLGVGQSRGAGTKRTFKRWQQRRVQLGLTSFETLSSFTH